MLYSEGKKGRNLKYEVMFQRPAEPDIETEFLILGSGPAGVLLAKKLAEDGRTVWILGSPYESQLSKAGELLETTLPNGTMGLDLIEKLVEEMVNVGVKTKTSLAISLKREDRLLVNTKRQKFFAEKIIIATGAKQVRVGFNGEDKFFNKGISDCSVCDYPMYGNKVVGVLGNHKYTYQAANFLANQTQGVHLFWMGSEIPRVDPSVKTYSVKDVEAFGEENITGMKINLLDGSNEEIKLQGLFVEGKPVPSTKFLKDGEVELDEDGFVIIDENYQTSLTNVFAVGDVTGKTSTYAEILIAIEKIYMSLRS